MAELKMWSVVALAVFVVTVGAAPVPDSDSGIDTLEFLAEKACRVVNQTSGVTVDKMCGCDNEIALGVICDLGDLTLSDSRGNELTATFCRQDPLRSSDGTWTGLLAEACRISAKNDPSVILKDDPCPAEITCVSDVDKTISVLVDGTEAVASFCQTQLQEQEEEKSAASPVSGADSSQSEDSEESQSEDSEESQSEDSEDTTTSAPAEDTSAEEMCIRLSDN